VPGARSHGVIITHTTVINEYLEDRLPEHSSARAPGRAPRACAYWNKFCDEQ